MTGESFESAKFPNERAEIIDLEREASARSKNPILLHMPAYDATDEAAILSALRNTHMSGATTARLEDILRHALGAGAALVCANAASALHLALAGANLGEGTRILVPASASAASANAARLAGAEIVFADVDPDNGLMSAGHVKAVLDRIRRKGGPRVSAVISIHVNGQCAPVGDIARLAASSDMMHIEDASQALGTRYRSGRLMTSVGACKHAHATCLSFENIMGREGAVLTTGDDKLAQSARSLRHLGLQRRAGAQDEDAQLTAPGGDGRLGDIFAALAMSRFSKMEALLAKRRALAALYDARLAALQPLLMPVRETGSGQSMLSSYGVMIDFARAGVDKAQLRKALKKDGIETAVYMRPVSEEPYYVSRYGPQECPGARLFTNRWLGLPLSLGMSEKHVERVSKALARVLTGRADASDR